MKKGILCLFLTLTILVSMLSACGSAENTTENTESAPSFTESSGGSDTNAIVSTPTGNGSAAPPLGNIRGYNDIIEMYKTAVSFYPSCTEQKLSKGIYDGINTIPQKNRELYKKIFISGYNLYLSEYAPLYMEDGRNYFGYAIADINKNGSAELILMTDLYDIVAIFTTVSGVPQLVIDNCKGESFCRIDEQGRIYIQYFDGHSTMYTEIYSLTSIDKIELLEKYLRDNDYKFYNITGNDKISIDEKEWKAATHGRIYGNAAGIMTKNNTDIEFIRLFGELEIYLPYFHTWEWSSDEHSHVFSISNFSSEEPDKLSVDLGGITVVAKIDGEVATFSTNEVEGRIEFGLDSVWLVITESSTIYATCGSRLYTDVTTFYG